MPNPFVIKFDNNLVSVKNIAFKMHIFNYLKTELKSFFNWTIYVHNMYSKCYMMTTTIYMNI